MCHNGETGAEESGHRHVTRSTAPDQSLSTGGTETSGKLFPLTARSSYGCYTPSPPVSRESEQYAGHSLSLSDRLCDTTEKENNYLVNLG